MPIVVVCPACKAEFKVSEKFAGRSGPCPKCKAPIKVPTVAEAAAASVTIHAPEEAQTAAPGKGGKTTTGRMSVKPLARQETQIKPLAIVLIVAVIAAAIAGAWFGSATFKEQLPLRVLALLVVSIPIALAGYTFLRDEELEPWRGRSLWLRSLICAIGYTVLWIGYYFVPPDLASSTVTWFFLAPPLALVGAGIAYATFDLDFGNAFFHYGFYVVTTLGLGYLAGLQMPWTGTSF